jgi:hypothetical protein
MPDAPDQPIPSFTPGTPTAPVVVVMPYVAPVLAAASATLDPSGSNNAILATAKVAGTAGNDLTAEIVIAANSTALTVAETAGDVDITSGNKRRMIVTGSLTNAGNPVTFPPLIFNGVVNGKPSYISGEYRIESSANLSGSWVIIPPGGGTGGTNWAGSSSFDYPDQVVTWTTIGPTAGTPTVTAAAATAAQAIALSQTALSVTLTNAPGNDGTGTLAAVAETPLTGGDGVPVPDAVTPTFTPGTPTAPARPVPNFTPSNPSAPAQPIP